MYERLESLTREVSRLWGLPYRYNASMLGKGESIIANYRRLRFHTPMCIHPAPVELHYSTALRAYYEPCLILRENTRTRYTARNARVVLLCAFVKKWPLQGVV